MNLNKTSDNHDVVIGRERQYWEARSEFDWLTKDGIDRVIALLPPLKGDILELCSGSGMFTKHIPSTFSSYTCLDLSQSLLDTLKKSLPHITTVRGNAEEPDFADGTFDIILVFAGLHHLTDIKKTIHSGFRILRKGGYFICFEPNQDCWYRKPMLLLREFLGLYTADEKFIQPGVVLTLMKQAGFKECIAHYMTLKYKPSHLNFINTILANMVYLASYLSKSANWQAWSLIYGRK